MEVCITQSLYKTPRAPTEFTAMKKIAYYGPFIHANLCGIKTIEILAINMVPNGCKSEVKLKPSGFFDKMSEIQYDRSIEYYISQSKPKPEFAGVCIFGGPPSIFRKHIPWDISTEDLGMIWCIFAENGPLKGGLEPSLTCTICGANWWIHTFFLPIPVHFQIENP